MVELYNVGSSWNGGDRAKAREAWTAFWQEPGQALCLAGALDLQQTLAQHWSSFAISLSPGARILDLGCGAGAVARSLLSARSDVQITGIDYAKIPLVMHERVELLADTAMEALPFADGGFAAVTSQFGFEYSQRSRAATEMARMLAPGAMFSFLIHHADSSIVAANRSRSDALGAFLGPKMRAAFCEGDAAALRALMSAILMAYSHDTLVMEVARSLPLRIGRPQRERIAIWNAIEEALAPERCIAEALQACCVKPAAVDLLLAPLRAVCNVKSPSILREPNEKAVAWIVEGVRNH